MLSDFFRINLPYGLKRNENGEWMAFNREYKPIGFNENGDSGSPLVYNAYKGLTNGLIRKITEYDERSVNVDEQGNIKCFWLYNDTTNPMNQGSRENKYWDIYWRKLKNLAKLYVKYPQSE